MGIAGAILPYKTTAWRGGIYFDSLFYKQSGAIPSMAFTLWHIVPGVFSTPVKSYRGAKSLSYWVEQEHQITDINRLRFFKREFVAGFL